MFWGLDYKKIPVAYGMYKLKMIFVVEDDKDLTDDIFDKILSWDEEV